MSISLTPAKRSAPSSSACFPPLPLPIWSSLPDDLLIELCTYLSFSDYFSFARSSRSSLPILEFDSCWAHLCRLQWITKPNEKTTEITWRQLFRQYTNRFPSYYRPVYTRVVSCWHRLDFYLSSVYPAIRLTLQRPLTESQLQSHLDRFRVPIHRSSLVSYFLVLRHFNGQSPEDGGSDKWTGLFGGFSFYGFQTNLRFLPLEQAMEYAESIYARTGGQLRILPLTDSVLHSEGFVAYYLNLESGEVLRRLGAPANPDSPQFISTHPSFLEFFEEFTDRLTSGVYGPGRESLISRFAAVDPSGSDTTTRGIRIRVSVLYVPEMNIPGRYMFTYHVRIDRSEDPSEPELAARLTTRNWKIVDGRGRIEEVNGPGVVGEYPHMYPGCEPFEYESCCPLSTPSGYMSGSFQFQVEDSDEVFDALIQPFHFDIKRNFM